MHLIKQGKGLITRVIGKGIFELQEDFVVNDYYLRNLLDPKLGIDEDLQFRVIRVKKGFVTDFASTGRLGNIVLREKNCEQSGTIHDWLYSRGRLPRKHCDRIFRECLIQIDGISKNRAWLAYFAVRIFSAGHFGKKK